MNINISVTGVAFAVGSVIVAKFSTDLVAPFLERTLELTPSQKEWMFLLSVWAIGYWGHALKAHVAHLLGRGKTQYIDIPAQREPVELVSDEDRRQAEILRRKKLKAQQIRKRQAEQAARQSS